MKPYALGASPAHDLFQPQAFRLRAEFPALARVSARPAMHDFLVPNLRPDLVGDAAEREERHPFIEPDSMFWSPESDAGDAA